MQQKFLLIKACICQHWALATLRVAQHCSQKATHSASSKSNYIDVVCFYLIQLFANLDKLVSYLQDTFGPLQAYLTDTARILIVFSLF